MTKAVSPRRVRFALRPARLLAAFAALVLLMTACSSDSTVTVADDDGSTAQTSDAAPTPTPTEEPAAPAATATEVPAPEPTATEEPEDPASDDPPADDPADDGEDDEDPSFVGADSDDFCRIARELDENDPFESAGLDVFSPEFFETILDFYARIEAIAPPEILPDFVTLRMGFEQFAAIAAEANYNPLDPAFAEATEVVDSAEFNQASENIDAYLLQVCGVDIGADDSTTPGSAPPAIPNDALEALGDFDLENLSPEDIAAISQLLFAQLDLDPELQACLLANADTLAQAGSDPDVLTQEICGTTLLNILSGLG